ncbi:MAG: hypothetical protein COA52_01065 [Hyphomicrobiales bacterium]|nr:MAG: hypothetical protein COA52_01065 [Hyphomicrobiales bacterium]
MIVFGTGFTGFLESLVWAFFGIAIFLPIFIWGPDIEHSLFPVINEETFLVVKSDDENENRFHIYDLHFDKLRGCELVQKSIAWFYYDTAEGVIKRMHYISPPNENGSRPVGPNVSNGWKIDIPENSGDQIIVLAHQCHIFWNTRTEIIINESNTKRK